MDRVKAAKPVGVDRRGAVEQRVIEREQAQTVEQRVSPHGCRAPVGADRAHDLHTPLVVLAMRTRLRTWAAF